MPKKYEHDEQNINGTKNKKEKKIFKTIETLNDGSP